MFGTSLALSTLSATTNRLPTTLGGVEVQVRVDGNQRLYRVDAERLSEVRRQLERFWGDRLGRLASGLAGEEDR